MVKIRIIKFWTSNKEKNERAHDLNIQDVELIDNDNNAKGDISIKTLINIYLIV